LQEIVDQYNHPTDTKNEREVEDINEINQNQIKQSNISNSGVVDLATLSSQQSAAPTNIISQMVNTKQIVQTPMSNNKNINIQQNLIQQPVQQINSQIQVKEPEEGEDLNKYFQIPTSLAKSKTTIPSNIDLNNIQKLIGQNQIKTQTQTQIQQQNVGNVASVTPLEGNDDINQYFNQAPYEQTKERSDQEILKKYFTPAVSHEINPEQINQNQLNLENIINMKDLPQTFGSSNIQQISIKQQQPQTTTTTTITKAANDNNNIKQITTTTKTTGNIDLNNLPGVLTSSEIHKIIDMKDLPATFGSNEINNFKQTTTTTTETIGNIPKELTNSEIKKIIDMKDLPETIGSTNMKKTTVTTTTESIGNIPKTLTNSEMKKIIDMKDLPETFGSTNMKKTTVTTTTTTNPSNINIQNLQPVLGNTNINNFKQTTTTTTETIGNIPKALTNSEIKKIIDMKDLPETIGSTNMKKTTVTTTTTSNPVNIDLKQFGLEQNPSAGPFASESIDLKQFGLEPTSSAVSTAQNKQVKTVTKTVQSTGSIPEQDYTKYFQNVQTTSSPIDLKQFGLEQNASNISNILQGSNITFKQPGQSIISSTNYNQNKTLITPAASSPIIYNDYNKYFKTANTIATTSNQNKVAMSTAVNPVVNYNLNAPYTKTATTTISKKTGIPVSSGAVTTNYTLPANYAGQKVTTSKVTKTYTTPTQISGYNYGYSVPGTTTTTTTYKK
jgi:hypothetical protein